MIVEYARTAAKAAPKIIPTYSNAYYTIIDSLVVYSWVY